MGLEKKLAMYQLYFEFPQKAFTVRKIAAQTKIPRATVQRYLHEMKKEGIINEKNEAEMNLLYKIKKTHFFIEKIVISGLLDELIGTLNPSCIILFGSVRKGDSMENSDIDIFVETKMKKIPDLKKFEKKLSHAIDIHPASNIHTLPDALFNNVVNGIKLYGSIKIK